VRTINKMKKYNIEIADGPGSPFTHLAEVREKGNARKLAELIAPTVENIRIVEVETTERQIRRLYGRDKNPPSETDTAYAYIHRSEGGDCERMDDRDL